MVLCSHLAVYFQFGLRWAWARIRFANRIGTVVSKILGKLKTAWALSAREKLWFVVLLPFSGLIRLALLLVPFRHFSPYLGVGVGPGESAEIVSEKQRQMAIRIGRICSLVGRYALWECKCLAQAIMAKAVRRTNSRSSAAKSGTSSSR